MTRKLTDKEEQSVRQLENLAEQYDAVGEKEAAQSFQQEARNLRHILEHSYDIAYKVFNHRSDEAIHHMPYTALYMNGSEICVLNYEGSPIMTRRIRKKWPFAVWCGWVCQVVTVLRSSLPQVR